MTASEREAEHVFTVSELTRGIKVLIEARYPTVWLEGEVSNYRASPVGHRYFTLKDEVAQISAVMFKSARPPSGFRFADGMKVLVQGALGVYEPRGAYQIIIKRIEERGVGALQLAFERLKRKLFEEGLFDEAHKVPIPMLPERIGVVTSPTGAAIRDILNVLSRRFADVHVTLVPVSVQGAAAAGEIVEALDLLNRLDVVDVIILTRGGGSIEDLWPFNEEGVARAIFRSRIPVISAVGHEIDWTISDFVADLRVPTPSAAAELVIGRKAELLERVGFLKAKLYTAVAGRLGDLARRLEVAQKSYVFREPAGLVRQYQQRVDDVLERMALHARHLIVRLGDRTREFAGRLNALNPLAVLARGYSVTTIEASGALLTDASAVRPGDRVHTRVHRGSVTSEVTETAPDPAHDAG
ncbi:MAG: exodeoxyribonuclease VII large subunit [Verrucomicrobia bacterium]|nr:exodeoxyribonuclease VII large subunit [Verrucomicrobiota bacterium]